MKLVRIVSAGLIFLGLSARAMDLPEFALTGGYRSNSTDADTSAGFTAQGSTSSYQLGALGIIPLTDLFKIRTGILYTQRYVTIGSASTYNNGTQTNSQLNLTYLDIPLTIDYQFSDYAGLFAGPVFAFNQSSSCSNVDGSPCSTSNVTSTLIPLEVGFIFKFAPNIGGEVTYEMTSSKVATGVKNMRSIGVNLTVFFE